MKSFKSVVAVVLIAIMMPLSTTTEFAATSALDNYTSITPFWTNTSDVNKKVVGIPESIGSVATLPYFCIFRLAL